jgi:LPXTG-motif cell wall-anchored protein
MEIASLTRGVKLRKLMLLIAMVAVALLAASPAMAQMAGIENGPKAEVKDGVPSATAGGASAKGGECPEAVAGGVVAKAGCEKKAPPPPAPPKAAPPAPAPAPKAAPAPAPKAQAQLPKTGGSSVTSLYALGAGLLLVGGGLLARRIIK